jgi:small nuclear ribonucleoprotein (snRNP)-like protein
MSPIGGYDLVYSDITVKLTDGSIIKGQVNHGHDYKRLSDYIKLTADKFITIVAEDPAKNLKKVLVINKDQIVWADID